MMHSNPISATRQQHIGGRFALAVHVFLSVLLILGQISLSESQQAAAAVGTTKAPSNSSTQTPAAQPTTSTTAAPAASSAPTTQATTTTKATTELPAASGTTIREPTEQEIQEARKIIHEIATTLKDNPSRLVVNKPVSQPNQDFAPESPEARVAEATSQFGLDFIKSLPVPAAGTAHQNVVISPVSMQILLNIILMGARDQSATQLELLKVLNYQQQQQAKKVDNSGNSTLHEEQTTWPHAAMHSLLENISRATHLTIDEQQQQLLNSDPQLAAHLQTSVREGEVPLSGQVNFTLANLMLTNSDLVKTSSEYEENLKRYYDIKLEQFSRLSPAKPSAAGPLHERVNNWVKNITQGQIPRLVEESDLSGGDLAMVLLNAAHFKGRWLHTFNTKLTQDRIFYNEGQELGAQEVKFMRQNGVFGYGDFGGISGGHGYNGGGSSERSSNQQTSALSDETVLTEDLVTPVTTKAPATTTTTAAAAATTASNGRAAPANEKLVAMVASSAATSDDAEEREQQSSEAKRYELTSKLNCTVLMLPFSLNDGQELSMIVMLPHKLDGLDELVKNLNGQALNEVYNSLNEQQVQVEMPKFNFESSHDAGDILLKMGLSKIFSEGAELDRMFAEEPRANGTKPIVKPPVKVDKVIHKAKIAIDEVGAEAAAASAATIVLRNLIRPPNPSFVANHPFLFIIRHNRSNLPLFMGRIERL